MMMHSNPTTNEQANAATLVIWDINTCPVLINECDASRVGPCIRRALKNLGYNGPVTIYAVGMLTDLPIKLLQLVSSTGIALFHNPSPRAVSDALRPLYEPQFPPRSNILLFSPGNFSGDFNFLQESGYNVLPQVLNSATSAEVESFWKSFLKEEEKCSETSETSERSERSERSEISECEWFCVECEFREELRYAAGQGFGSFIDHLLSGSHREEMLDYLPPSEHKSYVEKYEAFCESFKNATASVDKELKRKRQNHTMEC